MDTLTKLALGLIGQNRPRLLKGTAAPRRALPAPATAGGLPLMEALSRRQSQRGFSTQALAEQQLSDLLWAANGINRPNVGGHTAPSAMHAQEVDIYAALPDGLYRYDPSSHSLEQGQARDVRRVTGYQDFVDEAALDLVYVADHSRMARVPAAQRVAYASCAAGAIAQNVYLYCASSGLATVLRAWFDRQALTEAMGLQEDEQVLFAQTVGYSRG